MRTTSASGPLGYIVRAVAFLVGLSAGLLARELRKAAKESLEERVFKGPPHVFSNPPEGDSLSPRELEVLELMARGSTNAQIAARFVISEETVKSHVKHIFQKLVVANRTEAALRYVELYGQPSQHDQADAATADQRRGCILPPRGLAPPPSAAQQWAGSRPMLMSS